MKDLYMNPCGRDQWIALDSKAKKISLQDIQSGEITFMPFLTPKEAKENYNFWLMNQENRLPKTFVIDTLMSNKSTFDYLRILDLEVPEEKDQKKFLLYHYSYGKHICIILDEKFNNPILPVLDNKYLSKACKKQKVKDIRAAIQTLQTGIFRGVDA